MINLKVKNGITQINVRTSHSQSLRFIAGDRFVDIHRELREICSGEYHEVYLGNKCIGKWGMI